MFYPPAFWGWPGFLTMVLMMVLFWGGLIVLALVIARSVREVRARSSAHRPSSGVGTAEQILAERFARGEIDEDAYRRYTQVLREHPGSGPTDHA
jgi:putative membrane protein